jgi:hypothetical protein
MTKATQAVLADALRLEPKARAELAAELLASLDGPTDPDVEAAWATEIEKRVAALEALAYFPSIPSRFALNSLPGFHSGNLSACATR